jgi:glycosyltransferase involved in cell wall biosynthesis
MIALLGRRDTPTDGLDDYCKFLGQAFAAHHLTLTRVHVRWDEEGWIRALRCLWRDSADWRGNWVLLQYTALSWSRRGFPWGVLAAAAMLRRRGARCAVVFHEPTGYGGARLRERVRRACQMWILRMLYRKSTISVFTVPLDTVGWLPPNRAERVASNGRNKAVFIPIGANIPECPGSPDGRFQQDSREHEKRVVIFGVTGAPAATAEVADITSVAREASTAIPNLRLIVVGRGSSEVREDLANALAGCSVGLDVRGILPAEEIAREFRRADVLLFVRGAITTQRGGAMAGIACGLPIVGYGSGERSGPLAEAGIEWIPLRDQNALARALVRVLTDPQRWMELHERNARVQEKYFSWSRIAELYIEALAD